MNVDTKNWIRSTEKLGEAFACCNIERKFEARDDEGIPQSNSFHLRDVVTPPHSPSHEIHKQKVFQLQSENENIMKNDKSDEIYIVPSNMQEKEYRHSLNLNKDNSSFQRDEKVQQKMNYHPTSRRIMPFMEVSIIEQASSVYSSDDSSSHGRQEVKAVNTEDEILWEDQMVEEILQIATTADSRLVYRRVREGKSMETILFELCSSCQTSFSNFD